MIAVTDFNFLSSEGLYFLSPSPLGKAKRSMTYKYAALVSWNCIHVEVLPSGWNVDLSTPSEAPNWFDKILLFPVESQHVLYMFCFIKID